MGTITMRNSELLEHHRSVLMRSVGRRRVVAGIGLLLPVWALVASTVALAQTAAYTWEYRYDAMRRVTGAIAPDPDGGGPLAPPATRTTYDGAGRAIKVETGTLSGVHGADPAQWSGFTVLSSVEYTYDVLDRKTKEVSKGGDGVTVAVTQFSYDSSGRLQCSTVRMNLSAFGSLPASACTPGAAGSQGPDRITQLTYDTAEQLTTVQKAVGTDVAQDYATYTYWPNGQQKTVKDAKGNLSYMDYDGFDRLSRWTFPSPTTPNAVNPNDYEQYGYDENSNRTSLRKRDGSALTYHYDALNRMDYKIVPERAGLNTTHTRDVYFGYDLLGHQTTARFDIAQVEGVTSSFNGFGDLIGTTLTMDGVTRSLSYQRDKDGNRTELTWMDSAKTSYGYDGMDRMNALYEGALGSSANMVNYGYNQRTLLGSQSGRFGQLTNFGYDPAGRLTSLAHDLAGTTYDVTYGFTQINPAGQITRRSTSNAAYAFTGASTGSLSYATNGLNQYSAVGGATFGYDVNGNLTSDGGTNSYLYDVENRLVSATKIATSSTTTLRYDPLGRLYETANSAGTTRFLYDGDELVAEFNGGTLLRRYAHGSRVDDPVVWYEGSTTTTPRWLHTNWQGSIVAVTDNTGTAIARNTYDEYGAPAVSNMGRFQYTGQAWIPEIGLYYYKARIYSPALGRFLQTDPIGYNDDLNLYTYVGNDPLDRTDPTGAIADTLLDIGFIGYDLYQLATNPSWTNAGALGADIFGAAVPFVTGLGAGLRVAAKAGESTIKSTKELRGGNFAAARESAIKEHGGKCQYCGKNEATQGDHAKALNSYKNDVNEGRMTKAEAKAEANSASNVVGACKDCNQIDKGTKDLGTGPDNYTPPDPSDRVKSILKSRQ